MKKQLLILFALGSLAFALPAQVETKSHKAFRITSGIIKANAALAGVFLSLDIALSNLNGLVKFAIISGNSGVQLMLAQSAIQDFKD